MAYFQWKPALSTQIKALDEEHREMLDLAGRLQLEIDRGKSARQVSELFPELIAREKQHFAREEQLMKQQRFPGYAEHKRAHDDLAARLADLYDRLRDDEPIGSMALLTFMQDWLVRHIQSHDKELGNYLVSRTEQGVGA